MKIKARDIIAGWPKPRSTSVFVDAPDDLEFYRRVWTNHGAVGPYLRDLESNVEYHEEQKRMVHEFLERWRTPDKTHAVVIAS